MAESPSHRFGQIIGDTLEGAIRPVLEGLAKELGLYLDGKGKREARGIKRKVAWKDGKGNTHDLDYVLESGGTAAEVGSPRAFIEIAWRRYTKHSRNKAQEIQGAILPLAERYSGHHPALGVVLGGVFTDGSLTQLRSNGFIVLYFPYERVIAAFADVGIDAAFDEDTSDASLARKVKAYEKLNPAQRERIAAQLRDRQKSEVVAFTCSLRIALTRRIELIYVLPLHGTTKVLNGVEKAVVFIEHFDESKPHAAFARYEIGVRYSNGDEIRCQFKDKGTAIKFLRELN
jgi:hypothetical protein